jgi:enterochelin esterase-like enzyme
MSKKNKTLITAILYLITTVSAFGYSLGENLEIHSSSLSKTLNISIYDSYERNDSVNQTAFFILDGQRWFEQAVVSHKALLRSKYVPNAMFIGIDIPDELRRDFYFNKSEQLSDFLTVELPSTLKNKGHKFSKVVIFGWEWAGGFALHQLLPEDKISGIITASPFPSPRPLKTLGEAKSFGNKLLHVSVVANEGEVREKAESFFKSVQQLTPKKHWIFQIQQWGQTQSLGHEMTPVIGLLDGIRRYFHDYPAIEFESLDDYKAAGGISFLTQYYQNRSKKYGFAPGVPDDGQFYMLKLAYDSKNFNLFRDMDKFFNHQWPTKVHPWWANKWAQFAADNGDKDMAKRVYASLIEAYPKNQEYKTRLSSL